MDQWLTRVSKGLRSAYTVIKPPMGAAYRSAGNSGFLVPTGPDIGVFDDASFSTVEPFGADEYILLAVDGFAECSKASDKNIQFALRTALMPRQTPHNLPVKENRTQSFSGLTRAQVAITAMTRRSRSSTGRSARVRWGLRHHCCDAAQRRNRLAP